jgi:hypothetical protein
MKPSRIFDTDKSLFGFVQTRKKIAKPHNHADRSGPSSVYTECPEPLNLQAKN